MGPLSLLVNVGKHLSDLLIFPRNQVFFSLICSIFHVLFHSCFINFSHDFNYPFPSILFGCSFIYFVKTFRIIIKLRISDHYNFFMWVLSATKIPLISAFIASHRFIICFVLIFIKLYEYLNFLLYFFPDAIFLSSVFFGLYISCTLCLFYCLALFLWP